MAPLTSLAISVLALLNERQMHPYEMYQLLMERHEDRIVKVRPGSLYHTVERLAADGLVAATGTERCGNRPERTTYKVTASGKAALSQRLAELIETPVNEYPSFPVALGEAHNLDPADVVQLLANRVQHLDELVADVEQISAGAREHGVPEVYWLTAEFLRAMRATERDWIARLIDRIESKDLTWPSQ